MIYRRGEVVDVLARVALPDDGAGPSLSLRLRLIGAAPTVLDMVARPDDAGVYFVRLSPDVVPPVPPGRYAAEIWLDDDGVRLCLGVFVFDMVGD
ncbi:MAG: hypothetical protein Q4G25_15100 [Paracoccus sp. (in: a-proteobacteria)]|nr:hypothetical protein [Paracoccus sp. (in: a-proteobacteria)]